MHGGIFVDGLPWNLRFFVDGLRSVKISIAFANRSVDPFVRSISIDPLPPKKASHDCFAFAARNQWTKQLRSNSLGPEISLVACTYNRCFPSRLALTQYLTESHQKFSIQVPP